MVIRHPGFRELERWRIERNDAGLALIIGSRIGKQELESLPSEDHRRYLPSLFPSVPDIERLNIRVATAVSKLGDAELAYAYMAIPFVVSVFNEYLLNSAMMIADAGKWPIAKRPDELFLGMAAPAKTKVATAMALRYL